MPSTLSNLRYTVQWTDFKAPVPSGAEHDAHIETDFSLHYGFKSSGGKVSLRDDLRITINLKRDRSWAKSGAARTADLLSHEQGHYDITALTARDLFLDLMQLKSRTFASAAALSAEVRRIAGTYPLQATQDLYDAVGESNHGNDAAGQKRWDGYLKRAFTTPRTPAQHAPDGASYKLRLKDVLETAGRKP